MSQAASGTFTARWGAPLLRAGMAAAALAALSVVGMLAGAPKLSPPEAIAATEPPSSAPAQDPPAAPQPPTQPQHSEPTQAETSAQPAVLPDGRVVLNLATEDELRTLPGVGPSKARAIVALRQRLGRFRAVSDLLKVKGMGRKSLARLSPKVVVDPPRAPPAQGS